MNALKYVDEENALFINRFGMTKSEFLEMVKGLDEADKSEVMMYLKHLDERMYYQFNPIDWIEDTLGIKKETLIWSLSHENYVKSGRISKDGVINPDAWDGTPDPIEAICNSLVGWQDTAVESATGTGKTFIAAALMLWFLAVFPMSKVYMISTKKDALRQNLWPEVEKMYEGHYGKAFKDKYPSSVKMDLRIRMNSEGAKDAWVLDTIVAAVKADEGTAGKAHGKHAEHMLFVMDEANKIEEAIHEAIENTQTAPHNLRLMLANPDSEVDIMHQLAIRPDIAHIRISAYDFPNVVANPPELPLMDHHQIIPGAVSWKSIFTRRIKYGPDPEAYNAHPFYQSRVRGICPVTAIHSLFSVRTLEIVGRYLEAARAQAMLMGREGRWIPDLEEIHDDTYGRWGEVEGFTRIYEEPLQTHVNRYLIFGDVGGDKTTGDYHAAVVFDRIKKKIVALIRMRGHRNYYIEELHKIGEFYKVYSHEANAGNGGWFWPELCWEKNAVGSLELSEKFMEYPNLHIKRTIDKPKDGKLQNDYGHYTSSANRGGMMALLEEWGLSLRTMPWRVPDLIIFAEMKVFEWNEVKKKYMAKSSHHDDIMMAIAGALTIDRIIPDPVKIKGTPKLNAYQKKLKEIQRSRTRQKTGHSYKKSKVVSSWDSTKLPKTL